MTSMLQDAVARELAIEVPAEVTAAAQALAREIGGVAVLFYGSVLRTRALDDILDFYVLTAEPQGRPLRRTVSNWLWPDVSYHEIPVGSRTIRAKVATMPLAEFERAVGGVSFDTTVWIRFAQPCALAWADTAGHCERVNRAVTAAIVTAGSFAAALGPLIGTADAYWRALLRETYRIEFRIERSGREAQILAHAPQRYEALLPLAWQEAGIAFTRDGAILAPKLDFERDRALALAWLIRAAAGKPLNIVRLIKAAFTFEGATRYALWKVERHLGIHIALTSWRERHPLLAAPGVLWRIFRANPR